MKNKTTFLIIGFLLYLGSIHAKVAKTLDVAKAGTLNTLIKPSEKNQITNLTLTGYLNGDDILFIREMAGSDLNGKVTSGSLSDLDLSGANIVSGGSSYYNQEYVNPHYTSDNSISRLMFCDCVKLNYVTIPGSVMSIGLGAFSCCTGLISVNIPNSVILIGENAFSYCTGLTSVNIPHGVASIGNGAFSYCTGLTSITIPKSITSIEDAVFSHCSGLVSVTIPNSVTSIGGNAFYNCSRLASVVIPNSVTSIGNYAFFGCTELIEIHSQMKKPLGITSDLFKSVNKNNCILYVPTGSYQLYKGATGWKEFVNIFEKTYTPIKKASLNNTSVSTLNNAIIIQNAHGETISVYTPSGALLRTIKASDDYIKIEVLENQIYLVKIANSTYKVAVN